MKLPESKLTKNQHVKFSKLFKENQQEHKIEVDVQYDDECGNGHNSFSITGNIYSKTSSHNRWRDEMGSCIHEEIIKQFPDLEPFIKWHLTSSDGPMHYIANTLHHAEDKDCWGKRKGEPSSFSERFAFLTFVKHNDLKEDSYSQVVFPMRYFPKHTKFHKFLLECLEMVRLNNRRSSVFDFEVVPVDHPPTDPSGYQFEPKYTWGGFNVDKWHECPFDTEKQALEILECFQNFEAVHEKIATAWSKGKPSDLEAARNAAVWPDATLEQLTDKQTLENRLPGLMQEFKTAMESLGFTY